MVGTESETVVGTVADILVETGEFFSKGGALGMLKENGVSVNTFVETGAIVETVVWEGIAEVVVVVTITSKTLLTTMVGT